MILNEWTLLKISTQHCSGMYNLKVHSSRTSCGFWALYCWKTKMKIGNCDTLRCTRTAMGCGIWGQRSGNGNTLASSSNIRSGHPSRPSPSTHPNERYPLWQGIIFPHRQNKIQQHNACMVWFITSFPVFCCSKNSYELVIWFACGYEITRSGWSCPNYLLPNALLVWYWQIGKYRKHMVLFRCSTRFSVKYISQ